MRKKFSKKTFIALFTSLTMLILACVFLAAYIIENNKYRTFTPKYNNQTDVYDEKYYQAILDNKIGVEYLVFAKNEDGENTYTLIGFNQSGQGASYFFRTLDLTDYNTAEHIVTRIALDNASIDINLASDATNKNFTKGMKQYIRALIIPNTVIGITEQSLYDFGSLEYLSTPFIGTERGSSTFGKDPLSTKASKPLVSMFSEPGLEATFVGHDADENGNLLTTTYESVTAAWYEQDQPTQQNYIMPKKLSVLKITDETSLGNHALFNINSLVTIEVTAAADVDSFVIGTYCFAESLKLTNVVIPKNNVSFYGEGHFSEDYKLRNIELPSYITSIPEGMFKNDEELRNVIIPDTIKEIRAQAFYGCRKLEYVIRKSSSGDIISTYNGVNKITVSPDGYEFIINTNNKITNKLDLPSQLESIATEAFVQCIQFTSIVVPNSVNYIGEKAFNQCGGLEEISLPFVGGHRGTTNHNSEISGCDGTGTCNLFGHIFGESSNPAYDVQVKQQVAYPSTDPNAPDDAKNPAGGNYAIPKNLTTVYITDDTQIALNAFQNFSFLETLVISDTVTTINEGALNGCGGIVNLTIPFMGTTATSAKHFGTIFGSNIPAGSTGSYQATTANNYQIPESLLNIKITNQPTIYSNQLASLRTIETVEISDETNYIQEAVFYDNPALTTLYVPFVGIQRGVYYEKYGWWFDIRQRNTLLWMFSSTKHEDNTYGNHTLEHWHNYIIKYVPKSLVNLYITSDTAITNYGLNNFSSIQNLYIYSGRTNKNGDTFELQYIEEGCLRGCSSLEILEIPFVGYDINSNTVSGAKYSLGHLFGTSSYNDEYTKNGDREQYKVDNYSTYYVPNTLTGITVTSPNAKITGKMFKDFKTLTSINFPNADIQSLGDYAFANCTGLNTVLYPKAKYTAVGNYAFYKCINIHNIYAAIPDTVNKIGNYSFAGSSVGDNINPIDLTRYNEIGNYAFYSCMKINQINITNNVTKLGEGAFQDCQYLTDVTLTKKIVSKNLFKNCYSLKIIDLRGITVIPDGLFDGCYNLLYDTKFNDDEINGLIIDKETTSIGKRAFANCSSLQRFDIFSALDFIDEYAFYGCTGLEKMHMLKEVSTINAHAWEECNPNFYFTVDIATSDWPSGWTYNWNCGYPVYAPSDLTDNIFEYEYDYDHQGYIIIGTKPDVELTGLVKIPSTHDGLRVWGISNQGVKNNNGTPDDQADDYFEYKLSDQSGITAVVIPSSVYYIAENTFANENRVDLYFESKRSTIQNYYDENIVINGKRKGWNTYSDESNFIKGGLVFYGENWQYGTFTESSQVPYVKVSNAVFDYDFDNLQYTAYEIKASKVNEITLPGYVVINTNLGIDSSLIKLSRTTFLKSGVNLDEYEYAGFDPTTIFNYTYYNNIDAGQARVVATLNNKYTSYLAAQTEFGQNQILLVGERTQNFTILKASIEIYMDSASIDDLDTTYLSKSYDEKVWKNDSWNGLVDGLDDFNAVFTGRLETKSERAGVYRFNSNESGKFTNGNNFYLDYRIRRNGRDISSNFDIYLYLQVDIKKRDVMIEWTNAAYDTNNDCYLTYYNGSTPAIPDAVAVDYLAFAEDPNVKNTVKHCEVEVTTSGITTLIPSSSKYKAYAYLKDEANYRLVDSLGNPVSDNPVVLNNSQKTVYKTTDFIIGKGKIEIEIQAKRIISPSETCWSYDFNLTQKQAAALYDSRTADNIYKITGIGTDTIFSGRLVTTSDANTLFEWGGETNKVVWEKTYRENSSTLYRDYHLYQRTKVDKNTYDYTPEDDYYDVIVKSISVIIEYRDMADYVEYYVSHEDGTNEKSLPVEETNNISASGRNVIVANYNVNGNTFIIYVKVKDTSGLTGIYAPTINYFYDDGETTSVTTPMKFKEPDILYSVGIFIEGHHFLNYNRSVYLYTHKSPVTFMDDPLAKEYDRKQIDLLQDGIITDLAQEQADYLSATPECLKFYSYTNSINALPNAPTDVGTYRFKLYLPETTYYLGVGESLEKPATYTISINKREIIIDLTGETTTFTDDGFIKYQRKYNDEKQRFTPDSDALIAQGYVLGEDTDLGFPADTFKGYFETAGITPQVYEASDILSYWSVVNSETGIDVSKNYKVTFINSYEIINLDFIVTEHSYDDYYDGSYHTTYVTALPDPDRPQDTFTIYYSSKDMFGGEKIDFSKAITTPFGRSTPTDEPITYYYAVVGKNYNMVTGTITINIKYLTIDVNDPAKEIIETTDDNNDTFIDDEMVYIADYNGEYQKYVVTVNDPWYAKVYYSLDQVNWTDEPYEIRDCNDDNPLRIYYKVEADYHNTLYSMRTGSLAIEPVLFYVTEKRYNPIPDGYCSVVDTEYTYDGEKHGLNVTVTPQNNETYVVHYSTDGSYWKTNPIEYSEAGEYEIYVRVTVNGFRSSVFPKVKLTIKQLEFEGISVENTTHYYDGNYYTVKINGLTYENGVYYYGTGDNKIPVQVLSTTNEYAYESKVGYVSLQSFKDVSTAPYKLWIIIRADNYKDLELATNNGEGLVTITKATVDQISFEYEEKELQYTGEDFNINDLEISTTHDKKPIIKIYSATYDEISGNTFVDTDILVSNPTELGLYAFTLEYPDSMNCSALTKGANPNFLYFKIVQRIVDLEYQEVMTYTGVELTPIINVISHTKDEFGYNHDPINDTPEAMIEVGEYQYKITLTPENPNYKLNPIYNTITIKVEKIHLELNFPLYTKEYDGEIFTKTGNKITWNGDVNLESLIPGHNFECTLTTQYHYKNDYYYSDNIYASNLVYIDWDIYIFDENNEKISVKDEFYTYELSAHVKITNPTIDASKIKPTTVYYDGYQHTITILDKLSALMAGATVKFREGTSGQYLQNPVSKTYVGTYSIGFQITKSGWETYEGVTQLSILPADLAIMINDVSTEGDYQIYDGTGKQITYTVAVKDGEVTTPLNPDVYDNFITNPDSNQGEIRYYKTTAVSLSELNSLYSSFNPTTSIESSIYKKGEASMVDAGNYYAVVCYYDNHLETWNLSYAIKEVVIEQRPIQITFNEEVLDEKTYDKKPTAIGLGNAIISKSNLIAGHDIDLTKQNTFSVRTNSANANSDNEGDGNYYYSPLNGFVFDHMKITNLDGKDVTSNYRPVLSNNVKIRISRAFLKASDFVVTGLERAYNGEVAAPNVKTPSDGALSYVFKDLNGVIYQDASGNPIDQYEVGSYLVTVSIATGTNYYGSSFSTELTIPEVQVDITQAAISVDWSNTSVEFNGLLQKPSASIDTYEKDIVGYNITKELEVYFIDIDDNGDDVESFAKVAAGKYMAYARFSTEPSDEEETAFYNKNYYLLLDHSYFMINPRSYNIVLGTEEDGNKIVATTEGDTEWITHIDLSNFENFPSTLTIKSKVESTEGVVQLRTTSGKPGIYNKTSLFDTSDIRVFMGEEEVTDSITFEIVGTVVLQSKAIYVTPNDQVLVYIPQGHSLSNLNLYTLENLPENRVQVSYAVNGEMQGESNYVFTDVGVYNVEFVFIDSQGAFLGTTLDVVVEITQATSTLVFDEAINNFTYNGSPINVTVNSTSFNGGKYSTLEYEFYIVNEDGTTNYVGDKNSAPIDAGSYIVKVTNSADYDPNIVKNYTALDEYKSFTIKPRKVTIVQNIDVVLDQVQTSISYTSDTKKMKATGGLVGADELTYYVKSANDVNLALTTYRYNDLFYYVNNRLPGMVDVPPQNKEFNITADNAFDYKFVLVYQVKDMQEENYRTECDGITRADISQNYYVDYSLNLTIHYEYIEGYSVTGGTYNYDGTPRHGAVTENNPNIGVTQKYAFSLSDLDDTVDNVKVFANIDNALLTFTEPCERKIYYRFTAVSGLYEELQGSYVIKINKVERENVTITSDNEKTYDGTPMFSKWINNCNYYVPQYTFTKKVVNGVTLNDDIEAEGDKVSIIYYSGSSLVDPKVGCIDAGIYTYTLILPETTYYLETRITNNKFTINPKVIYVNDKEAKNTTTYTNGEVTYVNNISNDSESKYDIQFADGSYIPSTMSITGIFQTTSGASGTYLGSNGSGTTVKGLKWYSEPIIKVNNEVVTKNYTVSLVNASVIIEKANINYNIVANDDIFVSTVKKEIDSVTGMDHWTFTTNYDGQTAYTIYPQHHLQMITPASYSSFKYSETGADNSWESYNVSYSQLGKGVKTFYIRIEATNYNVLIAKVTINVEGAKPTLSLKKNVGFGVIDKDGFDIYEYNGTEVGLFDALNDFTTNNTEIVGASNYTFTFYKLDANDEPEFFSKHVYDIDDLDPESEWIIEPTTPYSTPRNIGKYRVEITQGATTNFGAATITHDFEIVQSEVSAAWTDTDYTYNGLSHYPTPTIELYSSDSEIPVKLIVKLYSINDLNTEIPAAINAGTYRAVVTIDTDSTVLTSEQKLSLANYKIKQSNSTIQYTIAKRDLKISLNAQTNYTYNKYYKFYPTGSNIGDGFFSPQGIINDAENGIFHSVQGYLQTTDYVNKNYKVFGTDLVWINDYSNTGTTKIKILDQSSVSVESNYNVSYELNVKVDFTATETSAIPYSGVYDGKPHSITVTVNNTNPEDYIIEYSLDGENFKPQNYEFTDVKSDGNAYIVYYRAYKASDGDEGKANATVYNSYVAITKKNAELSFVETFPELEKGKVYDGVPVNDPQVECLDTTAKFTYKYYKNSVSQVNFVGSNTYSQAEVNGKIIQQFESTNGIIPVSVGKYILVVELENNSSNYMTTSKQLEFEITKRNVLLTFNSNKRYDQVAWSKTVKESDFDNLPIVSGHKFNGLLMTKSVNVGTYDTISQFYWSNGFTIKDAGNNDVSSNYEILYQLNVEITKAPMSAKIVPYEGTWDGKEHGLAKIELLPTIEGGKEYPVPLSYTIEYKDESTNEWTTEPITKSEVGYYPIAIRITANNYIDLYIINTEEYKSYIKINGLKWTDPDFATNFQYEHPYQYTGTPYPTPVYINCPSGGEQEVVFYSYDYYIEHMNTTFSADTYLDYESGHLNHKIDTPVDVGEYVFVLKIASDGVYEPMVFIQVFTIDKKDVEVEWEDLSLEYTGYQLSPTASYYTVEALGSMKMMASLSSNAFQTLIGVYANVVATTDDDNYNLLNNVETFEITRMIVDRPLIREDIVIQYYSPLVIMDTSDNTFNLNSDGRITSIVDASGKVIYKLEYETNANGTPNYSTAQAYKSSDGENFEETSAFPYTITVDSDTNVGIHEIVVSLDKYQTIDGYDTNYMWDTKSIEDLVFTYEITTWKFPNSSSQLKFVYNDTHFYTGDPIEPPVEITVVDSSTQQALYKLKQDVDYTIAYDKNVSVTKSEKAEIIVTFEGNFEVDVTTLYFDILATEPTLLTIKEGKKIQFIQAQYDDTGVHIYEDDQVVERVEENKDNDFYVGHVVELTSGNDFLNYFSNDKNKLLLFGKDADYTNKNNALTETGLSGNVGTGFTVVLYTDETHDIIADHLQVIIYGDLDGNGNINANDSLAALNFGGGSKVAKSAATPDTPAAKIVDDVYYFAGMTIRTNKFFVNANDSLKILQNSTNQINADYVE